MCVGFTVLHVLSKTGTVQTQPAMRFAQRKRNSNDYCGRALGSIFDDSCTLLQGARYLRASRAKSHQKCETVVEFELQQAEMGDGFKFVHACLKQERFKCSQL